MAASLTPRFGNLAVLGLTIGFCLLPTPAPGDFLQDATNRRLDPGRRDREDREIGGATNSIDRAEARLAAAAAAIRVDIPPRLRTRLWWTEVDPADAEIGSEAGRRADMLATAVFAELLSSDDPAADRLRARATVIGATGRLMQGRTRGKSPGDDQRSSWPQRLASYHKEIGNAADRTGKIDGPTLLILSAATLAADPSATARALELHRRAGVLPEGIDAVEYQFIESLIEDPARGGVEASARIRATERLLPTFSTAADRLLLGAIQMEARLENGESPDAAIDATRRSTVPIRGMTGTDRVRLLRGIAGLGATSTRDLPIHMLPPLAAIGRLADTIADAGPSAWNDPQVRELALRACSSTVPEVQAEALLDSATLAMRSGDAESARDVLVEMIESLPSHPKALTAGDLAVRLALAGEDDDTVLMTTTRILLALPDHPGRDEWLLDRARRASLRGDVDLAKASWLALPESSDAYPQASLGLIKLDLPSILDTDDEQGATGCLARLDRIDERIPRARSSPLRIETDMLRIRLLTKLGRISEAGDIAASHLDIENAPQNLRIDLAGAIAPALEMAGRREDSATLLARLDRIQPGASNAIAAKMLQGVLRSVIESVDRDDRDTAKAISTQALAATPIDIEVLVSNSDPDPTELTGIAWLFVADGRAEEAMRLVVSVLEEHPSAIEALYLRAVILGRRFETSGRLRSVPTIEDAGRAIKDLRRIIAGSERGSRWWWRAELEQLELLVALGRDLDGVRGRLDRLRKEFPDLGGTGFRRRATALGPAINEARRRSR